ncbi:MAG: hypothetical protein AAF682_25815 [Planctomycetota bacterium]
MRASGLLIGGGIALLGGVAWIAADGGIDDVRARHRARWTERQASRVELNRQAAAARWTAPARDADIPEPDLFADRISADRADERQVVIFAETPDGRPLTEALEAEGLSAGDLRIVPIAKPGEAGTAAAPAAGQPVLALRHGPACVGQISLPADDVWIALVWNDLILDQHPVPAGESALRIQLTSSCVRDARGRVLL